MLLGGILGVILLWTFVRTLARAIRCWGFGPSMDLRPQGHWVGIQWDMAWNIAWNIVNGHKMLGLRS